MQAVILAGGLGTRLRPHTYSLPKAMLPVCGRPFMEYQLEALCLSGVTEVVICVGHLGHLIQQHFEEGARFGISIQYGTEEDRLLGTAGAIKNVEGRLAEMFFVIYGDTYPTIDFLDVNRHFQKYRRLGLMVVFRNEDRWDHSNVVLDDGFVRIYDKRQRLPGMVHIDFGVSVFRRQAFTRIPRGVTTDLADIYLPLIADRQLLAYEAQHRFYEVGSPEGLREFEDLVRSGTIQATTRRMVHQVLSDG